MATSIFIINFKENQERLFALFCSCESLLGFGETVIEELSSSSLLEPRKKKSRILIESEESASSASEEEEVPESLLEEPINLDPDGPLCCLCQRYGSQLYHLLYITFDCFYFTNRAVFGWYKTSK